MTRVEELTLKLLDGELRPEETVELDELLAWDEEAAAVHVALLEQEAALRGRQVVPDSSDRVVERVCQLSEERAEEEVLRSIERRSDRPALRYALAAGILLFLGTGGWLTYDARIPRITPAEIALSGHWQLAPGVPAGYEVSVRDGRRGEPLGGAEVELSVIDPDGRTAHRSSARSDDDGLARLEASLPDDADAGGYLLRVQVTDSMGSVDLVQGLSVSEDHASVLDWGRPRQVRSRTYQERRVDARTGWDTFVTKLVFAPLYLPLVLFGLLGITVLGIGLSALVRSRSADRAVRPPRLGRIALWWTGGFLAPFGVFLMWSEALANLLVLIALAVAGTAAARQWYRGARRPPLALARRDAPAWALVVGLPLALYGVWIAARFSLGIHWNTCSLALIAAGAASLAVFAVALALRSLLPGRRRWLERSSLAAATLLLVVASLRSVVWHFTAAWLLVGFLALVLVVLWRECVGAEGRRAGGPGSLRMVRLLPVAFVLAWLSILGLGGDGFMAALAQLDLYGLQVDHSRTYHPPSWGETGPNRAWVAGFMSRSITSVFIAAAVVAGLLIAVRLRTVRGMSLARAALAGGALAVVAALPYVHTRFPVGGPASKAVGAASAEQKNLLIYSGLGIPGSLAPPDHDWAPRDAGDGEGPSGEAPSESEVWRAPQSVVHDREEYDLIVDNPFLPVSRYPLSTFSVDVDTASYANVRRHLRYQEWPPPDAVRIEELINYFPYDYAPPTDEHPFAAHLDVAGCPWNGGHRLVRIALKGEEVTNEDRPPTNLVFLLDVSGSMDSPDKLGLVKNAMTQLTSRLDGRDRVSIVVYAGAAGLVLPATPGDDQAAILGAIGRLAAGGSTAGGEGIELAYLTAAKHFIDDGVNRVILATDGDFNVGTTSRGGLIRLIEKEAERGVFLTVLGVGTGNLRDSTMEQLADHGNGVYAYLDSQREARRVLVDNLAGTLVTIAKDVKLQVEFNPTRVTGYRLIGYENRLLAVEDFDDDSKDAGEIGAGHTVTALYEIIPAAVGSIPATDDELKYQQPREPSEAAASDELLALALRYKQPDSDRSELLTFTATDAGASFDEAPDDFRFAASVASFGMLLRDSPHRGESTWEGVLEMAIGAEDSDAPQEDPHKRPGTRCGPSEVRCEFIELVRTAQGLDAAGSGER